MCRSGINDPTPDGEVLPESTTNVLDVDVRSDAYDEWVSQCSEGIRLLKLQQDHSGHAGGFNGVSIVAFDTLVSRLRKVEIIHWKWDGYTAGVRGRVAHLDYENRLKTILAVGTNKEPIDFSAPERNTDIVWRDTGVKMVKAQWKVRQNQNVMPDHLMRILEMFREAEGHSANDVSDDSDGTNTHATALKCNICQKQDQNDQMQLPVKCCLCMLSSHAQCDLDLQSALSSYLETETVKADIKGQGSSSSGSNSNGSNQSSINKEDSDSNLLASGPSICPIRLPDGFELPRSFQRPTARQVIVLVGWIGFGFVSISYPISISLAYIM